MQNRPARPGETLAGAALRRIARISLFQMRRFVGGKDHHRRAAVRVPRYTLVGRSSEPPAAAVKSWKVGEWESGRRETEYSPETNSVSRCIAAKWKTSRRISVRSAMFIATTVSQPIKLRRSGMFRYRAPFLRATASGERRAIPCRSYGAWFKWGPVGTINMALLTELSVGRLGYSLENPSARTFRPGFFSRLEPSHGLSAEN
jgi:hypothetical protein